MHYRFDEGSGSALIDHSGNGRDGTLGPSGVSAPTWDGGGLLFGVGAGNGCAVAIPNVMSQIKTFTIACDIARGSQEAQVLLGCQGTSFYGLGKGDAQPAVLAGRNHTGNISPASAVPVEGRIILTFIIDASTAKIYYNGVEGACYTNSDRAALELNPISTTDPLWIGNWGFYFLALAYYTGHIYYMKAYGDALTPTQLTSDVSAITTALTTRGITLGNTITNKQIITFVGDSLTDGSVSGSGQTGTYPENTIFAQLGGSYNWVNMGKGGAGPTEMANPDPLFPLYTGPHVCVVWNSHFTGPGPTQFIADMVAYCTARRNAGWKVVLLGMEDQLSLTGGQQTDRATINASFNANWATYADAFCDLGSDAHIGLTGTAADTDYFVDGGHLTNLGSAVVAGYVKTALNGLGFT